MKNLKNGKKKKSKSKCKKCNGTGFIIDDKGVARSCECREKEIQKNKLKFLNMPKKYQKNRIKNLDHTLYTNKYNKNLVKKIKKLVVEYIKKINFQKEGLYIYSETKGSGKTHLATAIGNALVNKMNIQTKFATTLDILDAIKETYNSESLTTKKKLLYDIQTVEVLILDDLGVERPTPHTEEILYSIINNRISNNKKTIFTSNLKIQDLKLDQRIINRVNKNSHEIKMPEESIRTILAPKNGLKGLEESLNI